MDSNEITSGSDQAMPSTPNERDEPIFSDAPPRNSSPPSSPPGFPWESQVYHRSSPPKPARPSRNAFSVLGKRKALHQVSDNARLTKRQHSKPATVEQKPLSQMQISLGQEVQKKCKNCGMEYIASSAEDRILHDKYHKQNAEGYDVGKDFLKKARDSSLYKVARTEDSIVVVDHLDNAWRRKRARAALDIAQRELGAVDIPDEQLWAGGAEHSLPMSKTGRYSMYMYVRGTKCIGILLAERIKSAHKVVRPEQPMAQIQSAGQTRRYSALSALRARHSAIEEPVQPEQPIELSQKGFPASLGISRIWTSPSHRKQGIAMALLDMALSHHNKQVTLHNEGVDSESVVGAKEAAATHATPRKLDSLMAKLTKEKVAFSQPTVAGARLARKWIGKSYEWLVYVD